MDRNISRKPRILLIEDEVDWREEISQILTDCDEALEASPCYEVLWVESMTKAQLQIDKIGQGLVVDLVILDLQLSKVSGIDSGLAVLDYFRQKCPNIPCIVFTGHELSIGRANRLYRQYDVYAGLEKPRDIPRLRKVVELALANRDNAQSAPDLLEAGYREDDVQTTYRFMLNHAFNDEDLMIMCFEHFRPVYESFSQEMSKGQKILRLLDYCDRHGQIEKLLLIVKERNPTQYNRYLKR